MSTWQDRDDNVYDKLNVPKWLQDYMLCGVEIAHEYSDQGGGDVKGGCKGGM